MVYKGMLTTDQLTPFYPDLSEVDIASTLALVHSRFSTNTFPSWPLAHPYRLIAHNGEINTVAGNRNWMTTREAMLTSDVLSGDLTRLSPICTPGASDSASFDEVWNPPTLHARCHRPSLMMIPEAWENNPDMDPRRRAFYEFYATLMEPWDGPANVCFTDGTQIGAVLDRNGLRPGRFWVTDEGLVVLASEAGVLDIDPQTVVRKGRLQPGRMFLVDTAAAASSKTTRSRPNSRPNCRTTSGWTPASSTWRNCPNESTSCTPTSPWPDGSKPSGIARKNSG